MNNVIAVLEGTVLTLKIDLAKESKPGKTNGVQIHATNREFITVAHLRGREIAVGSLIVTSRPDPKLPQPEIKKVVATPEPKKVSAPAQKTPTQLPVQKPPVNPFNLSV